MEYLRSLNSPTEAKARSGRHAVLLKHECPDAFAAHQETYYQRFQPTPGPEADLVDQMVAASWRLCRLEALESAAIEHAMDAQRAELASTYPALDPQTRIHLAIQKLTTDSRVFSTYHKFQESLLQQYDRAYRNLRLLKIGGTNLTHQKRGNEPNSQKMRE